MYQNYADYYAEKYAPYLKEVRLVGGDNPIGMFECDQPAGYHPDDPIATYNLQLNIGLLTKAEVDLGVGKNWASLKNGELVVGPPETATTYDVITRSHLIGLGLPKAIVEDAAEYLGFSNFNPEALLRSGHNDTVIARLMKECWDEGKNDTPHGALLLDANMMAIAVRLVALAQGTSRLAAPIKRAAEFTQHVMDHIAHYVDTHIDQDIRVVMLANIAGMQEYGFARAFRIFTGLSPHQWVIERRIAQAAVLLQQNTMSVAEIAYAVGFSSQAHLTSHFSRRMGVGPAAYRKAVAL